MAANRDNITQRVRQTIADTFSQPIDTIVDTAARGELANWDSIGHLNLIMELESRFGISFTTDDVLAMRTLTDIVDAIAARHSETQ